jgi:hypothetical protein
MNIKENLDRAIVFIVGVIGTIAIICAWIFLLSSPFQLIDIIYFGFLTLIAGSMTIASLCYGIIGYVPILH